MITTVPKAVHSKSHKKQTCKKKKKKSKRTGMNTPFYFWHAAQFIWCDLCNFSQTTKFHIREAYSRTQITRYDMGNKKDTHFF